ncbi:MAG: hypothetical protein WBD87_05795 [Candidatus Acidiferrales bacterium]
MTTTRFPSVDALQDEIEDKATSKSLQFLLNRRNLLNPYSDLEEYAFSAPDPLPKELKGFEYHFIVVRNQILRVLRSHELFIGSSVIDELFFTAVKDHSEPNPVSAILRIIQGSGIHKPGFVIYPLHSFGVAGVGILETLGKQRFDFIIPYAGLAVRAQTNSLERTAQFLAEAAKQFGIARRIPTDSLAAC